MINKKFLIYFLFFIISIISGACKNTGKKKMFTQLSSSETGIHFSNDIHEDDSTKSFIDEFGYMGGGVGIGDFNNDGLKDIFFTGNQVSCRLYINKGNNTFEDITKQAGLTTHVWATGVSIVDINNDGYDDIYICVYGKDLQHPAKNLLFINQHNLTFKEEAAEYGLAYSGYSSQAVFFDYDNDGDLDMYLSNYRLNGPSANTLFPKDLSGHSPAQDRLYRNDGVSSKTGHPVFTDVTSQAGINEDGYGLGVVASDFNGDGWPDIYVANDFLSNDELWLNNKNGTFTNCIATALRHQSASSMGADAADINNDGLPDIATLDMMPEYNERKKTSFSFMNYDRYQAERALGYEPEFMRNMLQLNNGNYLKDDTSMPFFSEIGQLAGISATDWSWSVLMADFNNDGWKDIHITNGIGRDFINADFLEFSSAIFSNSQSKEEQHKLIREKLASLKHVNLSNYLYLNNHDDTFTDASEAAGINEPSMSNGAAYVDLDNDGDLDIVVNNINKEAFVFINNTVQKNKPLINHSISIELKGSKENLHGFGAKILLYANGHVQMQEENPVRGYFSSVDQKLIFGLGKSAVIDSVVAIWPGNKIQAVKMVHADTLLVLSESNAATPSFAKANKTLPLFSDVTESVKALYRHKDVNYNDFDHQKLLPQKFSQLGPFVTIGDIDKDGLMDFFVGGAFNFSGKYFIQQKNGTFLSRNLTDSIKMEEDMACILFDADGDGDLDLLVTGGDFRFADTSVYNTPRLYINDGKGNFKLRPNAIPSNVKTIAGCVSIGDYDGDGYPDVFIGGRVSKKYPEPARSFILHNDKGYFSDVTAKVCPALEQPGMVTSAIWTDFDKDGKIDLIVAGEWMPIRFFKNEHSHLTDVTNSTGLTEMHGMWRSLAMADIDGDGDLDLVAGNLGLNNDYKVSESEPMKLFATDLDGNGSIDPLLFYYIKDNDGKRRLYPAINKGLLTEQVPSIKKQFLYNKDYAHATFDDIFKGNAKDNLLTLTCNETRSCWFENMGNGKFIKHPLPTEAQFAPVNAIICDDVDNDGFIDLILAGNEYQAEIMRGRYDASYGCFLKGNGRGGFKSVSPSVSGLILHGDVKDMALIHSSSGEKMIITAINNDSLRVFKIKQQIKK
jgi:hypothetical protein